MSNIIGETTKDGKSLSSLEANGMTVVVELGRDSVKCGPHCDGVGSCVFGPLQVDEEVARLVSMPGWRRDIIKKKLDEEK